MSQFDEILRCLTRLETKVDNLESKVDNLEVRLNEATAQHENRHPVEKSRVNKIDQCIDLLYQNATATLTDDAIDKLMCKLKRGVSNQNVTNVQPNSAWPSTSKESEVFQIPSAVQSGSSVDNSSANVNRKRKANSNESTVVTFNHSGANGMTDEDKSSNKPRKNEAALTSGKSTAKPLVLSSFKASSRSNVNSTMPNSSSQHFEKDQIQEIQFRRSARNISKPVPIYRANSKLSKSKKVKTTELIEESSRKKLENLPNQKQTLEEFEKSHQSTGGDDKPQSKAACTQTSPAILINSNVPRQNSHIGQNNVYMSRSGSNLTSQSVSTRKLLPLQRDQNGQSNSVIFRHGMMETPRNEDRNVTKIDTPEKLSFSCRRNLWEQKTQDSIKNNH